MKAILSEQLIIDFLMVPTKQLLSPLDTPSDIPANTGIIDLSHAIESFQPGYHRSGDLPTSLPIFDITTGNVKRLSSDVELMKYRRVVSMPLLARDSPEMKTVVKEEEPSLEVSEFKGKFSELKGKLSEWKVKMSEIPDRTPTAPIPPRKDTFYKRDRERIDRRIASVGFEPINLSKKSQPIHFGIEKVSDIPIPCSEISPASDSKYLIIDDEDSLFSDLISSDFTAPSDTASNNDVVSNHSDVYQSTPNWNDSASTSSLPDNIMEFIKVYASSSAESSEMDFIKVYASPSAESSELEIDRLSPDNFENKSFIDSLFSDMDLEIGELMGIQKSSTLNVPLVPRKDSKILPLKVLAHEFNSYNSYNDSPKSKTLPNPPTHDKKELPRTPQQIPPTQIPIEHMPFKGSQEVVAASKVSDTRVPNYSGSNMSNSLSKMSAKPSEYSPQLTQPTPPTLHIPKSRKNLKSYQKPSHLRTSSEVHSNESTFSTDTRKSLVEAKSELQTFVRQRPFSFCLESSRNYSDSKYVVPLPGQNKVRSASFNQRDPSAEIRKEAVIPTKSRAVTMNFSPQTNQPKINTPHTIKVRSISALPITKPDKKTIFQRMHPRPPQNQPESKDEAIKKHIQSFFHGLKRQEIDRNLSGKCLTENQTKIYSQVNSLNKQLPRTPERENRFGNRDHYTRHP